MTTAIASPATSTGITIRRSADRGRANFGWLDSRHTFSFGNYYDHNHMAVSYTHLTLPTTILV